jgi:MarR family transcriptional regulator, organic hydroperoxide resistance regulator
MVAPRVGRAHLAAVLPALTNLSWPGPRPNRAYAMRTMAKASADDFQSVFWETKHALAVASMVAFSRHGVYEGQQYILRCLWEEDGLAPGEVARRLGISTPTVTRAGTRMEAAGLLRRQPHPKDRRLVRLVLTEKGRELEAVVGGEMDQLTERALASFSPVERAAVISSLKRIQANLTDSRPPG